MVVQMIQVVGVAVLEAEDDPPVAGDPHCMKPGILALQRVQPEAGDVDILELPGLVDDGQAVFDAADLIGG